MPWVYRKPNRTKSSQAGRWSDKAKMALIQRYLETGNFRGSCTDLDIPYYTAIEWKKSDWWKNAMAELRADDNMKLDAKLSKLVDKSLEVVSDRLENGDVILDSKTGKLVRAPVKMKDTAQMLDKLVDKRRIIRNEPTKIVQTQTSVEDHLKLLANKFAELVNKRQPSALPEVIEDAIYEERQEGLQEGESPVQLQPSSEETES